MDKKILGVIAAVIVVAAVLGLYMVLPTSSNSLFKVTYLLCYTPGAQFGGEIVAKYENYYAQEGLDVTIVPGRSTIITAQLLGVGKADLGTSAAPAVLVGRNQGIPVTCVALEHVKNPIAIFSLPSANINTPYDLIGKRIAVDSTATTLIYYLAMLQRLGIDRSKITELPKGFDSVSILAQNIADATIDFSHTQYSFVTKGYSNVKLIEFENLGITGYYDCIATSDAFMATHPDIVRKFVAASLKGWEYAHNHPQEAVNMELSYYPTLDPAAELAKITWDTQRYFSWDSLGHSTEAGWQVTENMLLESKFIANRLVDYHTAYTENFLP